jgi:hypothetical protein
MKPVGQRTVIDDGEPADEDAVLMRATFGLPEPYTVLSPVHIPRGFTKSEIAGEVVEDLPRDRPGTRPFRGSRRADDRGHRARWRGAVIGLSKRGGRRARAPAVIVSEGGVGRPIDESSQNAVAVRKARSHGRGRIVNKVDVKAQPGIRASWSAGSRLRHPPARILPVTDPVEPDARDDPQG